MKILVAGFEKWGPYRRNPAQMIAERLHGKTIGGASIVGVTLPVDFERLPGTLQSAIDLHKPDAVITLGLAFKDLDKVSLETKARKRIRPSFPDNRGKWPENADGPREFDVVTGKKEPAIRRTSLPVDSIRQAFDAAGIPFAISEDAGNHMCEQVFYLGQSSAEKERSGAIAGHLHLPHTPENAKDASSTQYMPYRKIEKAVRLAIQACAKHLRENTAANLEGS